MMSDRAIHIPIAALWDYSQNSNSEAFRQEEWDHLRNCDRCVDVLWACRAADSLDHAEELLKVHGIKLD